MRSFIVLLMVMLLRCIAADMGGSGESVRGYGAADMIGKFEFCDDSLFDIELIGHENCDLGRVNANACVCK